MSLRLIWETTLGDNISHFKVKISQFYSKHFRLTRSYQRIPYPITWLDPSLKRKHTSFLKLNYELKAKCSPRLANCARKFHQNEYQSKLFCSSSSTYLSLRTQRHTMHSSLTTTPCLVILLNKPIITTSKINIKM